MTPAEVLAAVSASSGWGSTLEDDEAASSGVIAALAAHGYRGVGEEQGVIGGEVVRLTRRTRRGGHYDPAHIVREADQ